MGSVKKRLRRIRQSMKQRCKNPKTISWRWYGGKGITYCDEWENFSAFFDWALRSGYEDGLTLDRIDSARGYSPDNCRWVDWFVQGNNRDGNHLITFNGETHTLTEWARLVGIKPRTLSARIFDAHWSYEKALSTPKMRDHEHPMYPLRSLKGRLKTRIRNGKLNEDGYNEIIRQYKAGELSFEEALKSAV